MIFDKCRCDDICYRNRSKRKTADYFPFASAEPGKEERAMEEMEKTGLKDKQRRDLLRTSMYAAYATPVIYAMLVNKASAAKSWNSGRGLITDSATPKPPNGGTVGPDPGRGRRTQTP
jgi:hypothetical protein